ncbi:hypothetical protein OPQ81_011064 [Rhizoctonia solani]|nr:hypothetical protein OPQ81_011064 [Rhizoctonia solani]
MVLKDEGSEINLINAQTRRMLGLPLDVNHRISMQGVNPGSRRSEGLCENIILAAGGIKMRIHLHVFENSPFDILLGQPWKSQYVVSEGHNHDILEMIMCDYRDTEQQVAVVLCDSSDPHWEACLDALQQPRT